MLLGSIGVVAVSACGDAAVRPAPTIHGFTPSAGLVGTTVFIDGADFTGTSAVAFAGTPAASFTVAADRTLVAVVAAGSSSGPISVTTPRGAATSADAFTVLVPPTLESFAPSEGPVGTTVTLTGAHLAGATGVSFGGLAAASFAVVSDTSLSAVIAPGTLSGTVTVTTPGGVVTTSDAFTVLPTPTVLDFAPASGPVGTVVTISGSHLTGATSVAIGGTATAFTVVSDSSVTAVVAEGTSSGPITVTTPVATATSSDAFTVVPVPSISGFTPGEGLAGATVTISGAHLTGASAVSFGGLAAASFAVVSDTSVSAVVAAGSVTGPISVTTPGGVATSRDAFRMLFAPTLTGFSPSSALVGASVSISGTHLSGATAVRFGDTPAASYTVVSEASITAVVAAGTASGPITVTTPNGSATSTNAFTVIPPVPVIDSFTPGAGGLGASVVIHGSGFTGASAVAFGAIPAASFEVTSDVAISAVVAAGTASGPIHVQAPGGSATSSAAFTFVPAPTLTAFDPPAGPIGTRVVITGTDLDSALGVSFHGTAAASFTVDSPTQISAVVAADTTAGPIAVTTLGGAVASATDFTVRFAPTIVGLSPAAGGVGRAVLVDGTDFVDVSAVAFGGTAAASFEVQSPTRISAVVAAGTATGPVTVTTPLGTATSGTPFTFIPAPVISSFAPASGVVGTVITIQGTALSGGPRSASAAPRPPSPSSTTATSPPPSRPARTPGSYASRPAVAPPPRRRSSPSRRRRPSSASRRSSAAAIWRCRSAVSSSPTRPRSRSTAPPPSRSRSTPTCASPPSCPRAPPPAPSRSRRRAARAPPRPRSPTCARRA
ncbi:MAG: hypothetical protein U1F43_38695 [Myxococcota bacterium]